MNALPQKIIFGIIDDSGCRLLEMREDGCAGRLGLSHRFTIQKKLG